MQFGILLASAICLFSIDATAFAQIKPRPRDLAFDDSFVFLESQSTPKLVKAFFLNWYPLFYSEAVNAEKLKPLEIPCGRYEEFLGVGIELDWIKDIVEPDSKSQAFFKQLLSDVELLRSQNPKENGPASENLVAGFSSAFNGSSFVSVFPTESSVGISFGFEYDKGSFDWARYLDSLSTKTNLRNGTITIRRIEADSIFYFERDGVVIGTIEETGDYCRLLAGKFDGVSDFRSLSENRTFKRTVNSTAKLSSTDLFCFADIERFVKHLNEVGPKKDENKDAINTLKDQYTGWYTGFGLNLCFLESGGYQYSIAYSLKQPSPGYVKSMIDNLEEIQLGRDRPLPQGASVACYQHEVNGDKKIFPGADMHVQYWTTLEQSPKKYHNAIEADFFNSEFSQKIRGKFETCEYLRLLNTGDDKFLEKEFAVTTTDLRISKGCMVSPEYRALTERLEELFANKDIAKSAQQLKSSSSTLKDLEDLVSLVDENSGWTDVRTIVDSINQKPINRQSFDAAISKSLSQYSFNLREMFEGAELDSRGKLLAISVKNNFMLCGTGAEACRPLFETLSLSESLHEKSCSHGIEVRASKIVTGTPAIEGYLDKTFFLRLVRVPISLMNQQVVEATHTRYMPVNNTKVIWTEALFYHDGTATISYMGDVRRAKEVTKE
jgi:hypothetical protein